MPVKKEFEYTKVKQKITRLSLDFLNILDCITDQRNCIAILERPVTGMPFKAVKSAMRCLEAQLICLELRNIPRMFIDSKQWQKELLPKGCKGTELKYASMDIGIRLFPEHKKLIMKQKDADGLLIAEWGRRARL